MTQPDKNQFSVLTSDVEQLTVSEHWKQKRNHTWKCTRTSYFVRLLRIRFNNISVSCPCDVRCRVRIGDAARQIHVIPFCQITFRIPTDCHFAGSLWEEKSDRKWIRLHFKPGFLVQKAAQSVSHHREANKFELVVFSPKGILERLVAHALGFQFACCKQFFPRSAFYWNVFDFVECARKTHFAPQVWWCWS